MINQFRMSLLLICVCLILPASLNAGQKEGKASSEIKLLPGNTIANFNSLRFKQPFVVQRLTDRTYFVTVNTFNSTIYVGDKGVLLFDPLSGGRAKVLLDAIASVTTLPITAMIYSHSHADHIGDAHIIYNAAKEAGIDLRVIGTSATAEEFIRFDYSLPAISEVVSVPHGKIQFEGLDIEVHTPHNYAHSSDTSVFYLRDEKVVHLADVIEPFDLPFISLSNAMDAKAFEQSIIDLLTLDWHFLNGGHGNVGNREIAEYYLGYMRDLKKATKKALSVVKMKDFRDPKTHLFSWYDNYYKALTEVVKKELGPVYGHRKDFAPVIESHVRVMRGDLYLHNP